jgi:MerR family transcriptional regulator/heat shock protein HspR
MEDMRTELEQQLNDYMTEAERRIQAVMQHSNIPVRRDESLLPVPNIQIRRKSEL